MTKQDTFWSLQGLVDQLPPDKRAQAAGALRTLRQLLEVAREGDV